MSSYARIVMVCGLMLAVAEPCLSADPPDANAILVKLIQFRASAIGDSVSGYRVELSSVDAADLDTTIALAAGLPNVTEFNLNRKVTDARLAAIAAKHPSLLKLNVGLADAVTDEGMASIGKLTKLTSLHITYSKKVTAVGLARLGTLTELQSLAVGKLELTGRVSLLAALPKLTRLDASGCALTDADLAVFAKMPNLIELGLAGNDRVTDAGIAHLATLKNIESLSFGATPNVRGPGLAALAALPKVDRLTLTDTGVTDDGLKSLAGLKQIKHLELPRGSTVAGLVPIAKLQQLETLVVPGAWPAADFEAARKAFPRATVRQQN